MSRWVIGRLAVGLGVVGLLLAAAPFGAVGALSVGAVGLVVSLPVRPGKLRKVAIWLNGAAIFIAAIVLASVFA